MKLTNGKLSYNTTVLTLVSCDMYFSHAPSRSNWDREGFYSNEALDNIEINFIQGETGSDEFEALKPTKIVEGKPVETVTLSLSDGALVYYGKFYIGQKINTKTKDGKIKTYERIMCDTLEGITKTGVGGTGGHVNDVLINGVSIVDPSSGAANIPLEEYAKKTETMKVGKDADGIYVTSDWSE